MVPGSHLERRYEGWIHSFVVTGVTLGFDLQARPPQAPLTERHYPLPCNRNQQSVSIMGLNPGAHEELPELKELSRIINPDPKGFYSLALGVDLGNSYFYYLKLILNNFY